MKITKRQLRRIIREMKSGQYEVNGQPFDDLAAAKKEAEASGFEVIDTSTEEVLYEPKKLPEGTKITRRQLRRIIKERVGGGQYADEPAVPVERIVQWKSVV